MELAAKSIGETKDTLIEGEINAYYRNHRKAV